MELVVLFVALLIGPPAAAKIGITVDVWNNTAMAGEPHHSMLTSNGSTISYDSSKTGGPFSLEAMGSLTIPATAAYAFYCAWSNPRPRLGFIWLNDHLVCQNGVYKGPPPPSGEDGTFATPLKLKANQRLLVKYHLVSTAKSGTVGVTIHWNATSPTTLGPIPAFLFDADISTPEQTRYALQKKLAQGWGTWWHNSAMALVNLPSSVTVGLALCPASSSGQCYINNVIDGRSPVPATDQREHNHEGRMPEHSCRVGIHAYDSTYAQQYVWYGSLNISFTFGAFGNNANDVRGVIEVVSCGSKCAENAIVLTTQMLWQRLGTLTTQDTDKIVMQPYNLPQQTLYFTHKGNSNTPIPGSVSSMPHLTFVPTGPGQKFGFSTSSSDTITTIESALTAALSTEMQRYAKYGNLSEVKLATQAAITWTKIFNPMEAGPFMPVSRGWNFLRNADRQFDYVIFDWDNIFASYITALDNKELSYSNYIQVIRSKTGSGFVPNYSAGGYKSQDRTEPPIGAHVLLRLYNKYKDKWLVELLFDDLVDWNDWFFENRIRAPLGMVCLGSSYIQGYSGCCHMQDARYESGLDNSPMYDGNFFDSTNRINQMELYDVGMGSMVVREADSLATLAQILGLPDTIVQKFQGRADSLRAKMQLALWDNHIGAYTNMFSVNATFYPRISPTSFYSMLAKVATNQQAETMVQRWLLNPDKFCISRNFPSGLKDTCYWGLPSINAADPAYPPLGYWRGYIWGPMAQLTYWSLEEYADAVPIVKEGKAALAHQMKELMLHIWNIHHHICENYNPHQNGTECTGDHFYHWGALTGLLSLQEAGYW